MIKTVAIANFCSINNLAVPHSQLNIIVGENGSGKSNFYKALRLQVKTAKGNVIKAITQKYFV